ncbi:nuclear factor of activated T-cells 5 isoform X1 [Periplaneta americana]|uniref:nuclear factor of activated T-cells 5 isoform X1 n=1 Tax=Periplaneta americana TaxID=6978 RepID=UPI0037E9A65E
MLLKYSQAEKRTKPNANGKQRATGAMKAAVGVVTPRVNRKVIKGIATKRTAIGQQRVAAERTVERTTVDPCDNSNDSGLGFDHHLEFQLAAASTVRFSDQEASWAHEHSEVKRKKLEIKLEADDANDNFSFPETMSRRDKRGEESDREVLVVNSRLAPTNGEPLGPVETSQTGMNRTHTRPQAITGRRSAASAGVSLTAQYVAMSRDGKTQLQILCQPEQQHRARYQTEGSRGAVKDRTGNGFPVVQLVGYNKPATLQVFIGTDMGRIAPHMFYQACRVSGKNSTPCVERKIDGTIVIEVDFEPAKDMVITCDCVGILKERNVDVEHRFPDHSGSRTKKKSTRCRMVFRTAITNPDGSTETLQTLSHPIVCTQPPGVPEICKKSLTTCPCTGGMELFILGKNFLKETRVVFKNGDTPGEAAWEEVVHPDKEFLQATHLVCVVPPYRRVDLTEPVTVKLLVTSSGKLSEPHTFTYTPILQQPAVAPEGAQPCVTLVQSAVAHSTDVSRAFAARAALMPAAGATGLLLPEPASNSGAASTAKASPKKSQFIAIDQASIPVGDAEVRPVMMWQASPVLPTADTQKLDNKALEPKELGVLSGKMMPPPLLPIGARRASSNLRLIVPDTDASSLLSGKLKTELAEDANSQSPEEMKGIDLRMKPVAAVNPLATVADLSSTQSPTMATFRRFVTGSTNAPLPTQSAQSVEKYLSHLEHSSDKKPASACKMADTVAQIGLNRDSSSTLYAQQQPETATNSVNRKMQFVNDLPLPLMYNTSAQECKTQFASEKTSLLQQATAAQHKSLFDGTMTIASSTPESVLAGRRPMVILQESQTVENQVPSNNACSSLAESLDQRVPILNSDTPALMPGSSGLVYASPERTASSTMLTREENTAALDPVAKARDAVAVPRIVDSVGESSLLSASSSLLGEQMLAVTESSIMASAQNTRLDALVSSAISNHVLGSGNHIESTETEKLDALVNSAAVSHMMTAPITLAENVIMNTPVQGSATTRDRTSPVKKMSLEPSANGLEGFGLVSSQHSTAQISRENAQLLSNAVSAALNGHLLTSGEAQAQAEAISNAQLNMNASASPSSGGTLYASHDRTSPIAVKNMILSSAAEGQILVGSPACTSPVAVKSMVLASPDSLSHSQILASDPTSPIAVKKMVAEASPESHILVSSPTNGSHVPVKNILNSTISPQNDNQIVVTSPTHTHSPPIAMKSMILESAAASCLSTTSPPIAVKTMIMGSPLEGTGGETLMSATTENARLDALVQSTLTSHGLVSDTIQVTSAMDARVTSIPVLSQSSHIHQSSTSPLLSQPVTTLASQPPNPASHLTPVTTGDALLSTIFATGRSSAETTPGGEDHTFRKEASVIVGSDLQTPHCTENGMLHAPQFTTVSSSSQNLLTGIAMPSKVAEELAAQSRESSSGFVTQMLLGLAAEEKLKKDSEMTLLARDKITEPASGFVSKLPETRLFASSDASTQSQAATMSSLALNKKQNTQESQEQQCKEQQQPPRTTGTTSSTPGQPPQKKAEEGMVPQELTQMSENDLLSYINPSTFDQV